MAWDITLFFLINSIAGHSQLVDWLIIFTATYVPYIVVAVFALHLLLRKSFSLKEKFAAFAMALAAALVARIVVGSPIRFFFPRLRPFLSYHVVQLIAEHAPSFPSGHSLFFFAFSTIVYGYERRLGVLSYALTILICLARVAAGIHYPSDILAGAVFGIAVGAILFTLVRPAIERTAWWKRLIV